MRVKQICVCRGSGKVYTLFEVRDLSQESQLDVTAEPMGNTKVPCELIPFPSDNEHVRCYVLVVPMLDTPPCTLVLNERDAGGHVISDHRHQLDFRTAKWESRLNYKVKPDVCAKIRDYDAVDEFANGRIDFWNCIEDGNEVILRCLVKLPYREDTKLRITCLTSTLSELPLSPIIIDDSKVSLPFSSLKARREVQVSLRLPNVVQRYIFLIDDENHPAFSSFQVLDGPMFETLRTDTTNRMRPVANKPDGYTKWLEWNVADQAKLKKQRDIELKGAPSFSIVVPLFKTPLSLFSEMVASVQNQTFENWELVLVNASPEDEELAGKVEEVASGDSRVKVVTLEENLGISQNTNRGIARASGDFICFLDHDDLLELDALFEYAQAVIEHPDTDLIYSDEDKLTPHGTYVDPFFKPDFSIDLLRNVNYICHFLAIRKSLLLKLEPSDQSVDGAQDHDITLKAVERARHVHHAARVLYHWRMAEGSTALNPESKTYALEAGMRAVQNHLDRMGVKASVEPGRFPFTYRVKYEVETPHPLVSIIIPSKDHTDVLDTCVHSIIEKSTYDAYEIVVVENNSTEQATFDYYENLKKTYPNLVKVVRWPGEFNFSKIVNFGVANSQGPYVLLLNNDTEIISPSWIEEMLGICQRKDVGAVGARLLYADGTIQHAGVWVNGQGAGHLFKDLPQSNTGYFGLAVRTQDLSAVTAACLMTRRDVYERVGGFTEEFAVAFNDVDFCLKVRDAGLLVVYTPEAELYHYESLSRGYENSLEKQMRFHRETALLHYRWPNYYVVGDPYINLNVIRDNGYYQVHIG